MKEGRSGTFRNIGWKVLVRFIIFMLIAPLILFSAAGTLRWVMGWVFVITSFVFTLVSRILVIRQSPDLLRERARSVDVGDIKTWDKVLLLGVIVGPILVLAVAGLDERFSWSPQIQLPFQLTAVAVLLLGYVVSTWAFMVNRFFSAVVRIQKDRNHTVVTTGPYRFLRHPGYAGGILTSMATPIMLGSLWALLPMGCAVCMYIVRTFLEDRTLQEELDGYKEYAQKVRFRLFPGLW